MSLLRWKLLTYLAQQKPNEREQCIQDYRNKDHIILNPRSAKRYQIDDSDKENSPYSCCRDEEECQNEDVEGTIRMVQDILTPEKSKKRVIRDTPDASIKNRRKRSKSGVKPDAVKAIYQEVTHILTSTSQSVEAIACDNDEQFCFNDFILPIELALEISTPQANEVISTPQANGKKYKKLKTHEARCARDIANHPILPPCVPCGQESKKDATRIALQCFQHRIE